MVDGGYMIEIFRAGWSSRGAVIDSTTTGETLGGLRVGSVVVIQAEGAGVIGDYRVERCTAAGLHMRAVDGDHEVTLVIKRY